jgi:hypothetical protein
MRLGKAEGQERLSQIGIIFFHVPKRRAVNDPLVSEFQSSISALFFSRFSISSAKRSRGKEQGD